MTSTAAKTVEEIKALIKQAKPDATDVTVVQGEKGFTVTISGDRESTDDESNGQQVRVRFVSFRLCAVAFVALTCSTTRRPIVVLRRDDASAGARRHAERDVGDRV